MTRKKDIRKSDFVGIPSSEGTDHFDLVRNGQNFKILQSDLVADFGASGPLEQRGEPTGTPVLTVITDVNYIRNLLGGSGIRTSVSPLDGVQIDHNFTINKAGVPVVENEGGDSPVIRSIQAGSGITVGGSSGIIQIAASGTPASTKSINVYSIDDFPTPSGGIITLADDTEYYILADISTANRFIFGDNTILSGADSNLVTLTYTGTGTMMTIADKNVKIKNCGFSCTSGTFVSCTSTTGDHTFEFFDCRVSCDTVGTIADQKLFHLYNVNFTNITTDGITFSGDFDSVLLRVLQATMPSGTGSLMDLGTATFFYWTMDQGLFYCDTTGAVLTGLANSGNIDADGLGVLLNSRQFGTAPPLNNISQYDDRWVSALNPHVPDSFDLCLVSHAGSTLTIAAPATPVIIGATWADEDSHRFTTTVGGRFTYTGQGTHCSITASITADIASGIDDCSFFIYLNGVQITNSRITREFNSGDPGNLSLIWELELEKNDYIELWAQNDDTSVNILIVGIVLRIRS